MAERTTQRVAGSESDREPTGADRRDNDPVIVVEHLHKDLVESRARSRAVINDISLRLFGGEFATVAGRSGSGKSLLMAMLAGLELPTSGTILLDGDNLAARSEKERGRIRNRKIGLLYRQPTLLADFSAAENVAMPMLLAGARRTEARTRAAELLDQVELATAPDVRPHTLTLAQRQRVALARALANRPLLLLADEPTGALDSLEEQKLYSLLVRLHAGGQTIVYATHDHELALRSPRRIDLVDGVVVGDRTR